MLQFSQKPLYKLSIAIQIETNTNFSLLELEPILPRKKGSLNIPFLEDSIQSINLLTT